MQLTAQINEAVDKLVYTGRIEILEFCKAKGNAEYTEFYQSTKKRHHMIDLSMVEDLFLRRKLASYYDHCLEIYKPTSFQQARVIETDTFFELYPETGKLRLAWDVMPRIWNDYPGVWNIHTWLENALFDEGDIREVWQQTTDGVDALLARYGYEKDGPVWRCDHNTDMTIALFCHFGIAMAVLGYLTEMSPMVLWHRFLCLPSSVTEIVTEERALGEVSFRTIRLGDLTHLESAGEPASTAGLFPMCYTGIDSTDPAVNGTL